MNKPTLPESPLPALLDHDGRFQALFPEDLVRQHGEDMIAFERARILALLDTFGNQCQAQAEAERAAREIAINQKSEVLIHGRDGRIRDRNSYGNDPSPPKG